MTRELIWQAWALASSMCQFWLMLVAPLGEHGCRVWRDEKDEVFKQIIQSPIVLESSFKLQYPNSEFVFN